MDYRKIAEEIYEKVGKKENIVSVAHCSTRLRLVLADNEKCDAKQVEEIDGVKGVFSASGQIQIILGTGVVNKVYDEFLSISGLTGASTEEAKAAATAKQPWYKQAIKTLGDIFVPIIQCGKGIWRQPVPWGGYRYADDSSKSAECLDGGNRGRKADPERVVWVVQN